MSCSCCPLGTQLFHLYSSEAAIICVRLPLLNLFCETHSFTRNWEISIQCRFLSVSWLLPMKKQRLPCEVYQIRLPKSRVCVYNSHRRDFFSIVLKVFKASSSQANFNLLSCSRRGSAHFQFNQLQFCMLFFHAVPQRCSHKWEVSPSLQQVRVLESCKNTGGIQKRKAVFSSRATKDLESLKAT